MKLKKLLILIFILFSIYQITSNAHRETEIITYTVMRNDTLWSIAERYTEKGEDIRETIYKIEKLNNMKTAEIYEGQEIKIEL